MTTKYKIIIGFLFLIVLMGCVGILSYTSLEAAAEHAAVYRHQARTAVFGNGATASLEHARYQVLRFSASYDVANMEASRKALAGAIKNLELLRTDLMALAKLPQSIVNEASVKAADAWISDLRLLSSLSEKVQEKRLAYNAQSVNKVAPAAVVIASSMNEVESAARHANNTALLELISTAEDTYVDARMSGLRFLSKTTDTAHGEKTIADLTKLSELIAQMDALVEAPEVRNAMDMLRKAHDTYLNEFNSILLTAKEADAFHAQMGEISLKLSAAMLKYSDETLDTMQALGSAMLADNAAASHLMVATVTAGILAGLVVAGWIIFSVMRCLKQLAAFSEQIAEGNFNASLTIREKGEVGAVVQAMLAIPKVLRQITEKGDALANRIAIGHFRNRFDTHEYNQGFADIAKTINSVAGAYTAVLDVMPTPLMTCDHDCKILFLNKGAQAAMGGDMTAKKCADMLRAKECNSTQCLGKAVLQSGQGKTAETTVHPGGKTIHTSVIASPLFDLNGKVLGFFEMLNDITEIRTAQKTMQNVATQASAISDRVAAASEELSAQVEQISRGAEMQKDRVESTATAMAEMNATVLEVARNAGQASEQSEHTRQNAESGAKLVNQVVTSINQVNEVALKLQKNMTDLGSMAERIGGVMNVISDIADQTNLLALNAAIEAARAGEAGRGFAVVADEVRKLAEKTMDATHEVGASITDIQKSAQMNVAEVTEAVENIGQATNLANSSGTALQEIVALAGTTSSVVASIATAAEEQSATSEEITSAINEINQIVSETTDGMIQSSAAVQELSRMAQELRNTMEGLR